MFYTYILQNDLGKRYIGSTSGLKRRLEDHNSGKVPSTKGLRPWKFVYYEAFSLKELALQSEMFYKTGQGRRLLKRKLGL